MDTTAAPRRATAADLPRVHEVIAAAYAKYRTRMDILPAPVLRDYTGPVEQGLLWVAGDPVMGLLSLIPEPDSLLIENVAVHPDAQGTGLGGGCWNSPSRRPPGTGSPGPGSTPTR